MVARYVHKDCSVPAEPHLVATGPHAGAAASKLALNNMVIRRGAFVDPTAAKDTALGGDGLMELLKPAAEDTAKGAPQSRAATDKVRALCTLSPLSVSLGLEQKWPRTPPRARLYCGRHRTTSASCT